MHIDHKQQTITNAAQLTGHYGMLRIVGPDATKFLQGQLTCNVEKLGTSAKLAAHCNPQGRVISLFYIFNQQDAYYLCLPIDMITTATSALKKYAVFFKVMIEEVTSSWQFTGYMTPHSFLDEQSVFAIISINNIGSIVIHDATFSTNKSFNDWQVAMIAHNIPTIYQATSSQFLPHELALPTLGAIDFEKGCYTGQEIIARMHYRGKLKMQLFYCTLQTAITPIIGADVYHANNVCGKIINCCYRDDRYHLLITADENKATELHLANDTAQLLTIITQNRIAT